MNDRTGSINLLMEWGFLFFFNSILFGVALAMDAFSVSIANALA